MGRVIAKSLAALSLAVLVGTAAPALAAGNLAAGGIKLPDLKIDTSGTFPTGATANPTLTISALALRTAESIAKRV